MAPAAWRSHRSDRKIWKKEISVSGLSWQASRMAGSAPVPTRLSTKASRLDGSGSMAQSPIRSENLEEGNIGLGPELAGQPNGRIRSGADPVEHEGFAIGWLRQHGAVTDQIGKSGRRKYRSRA